MPAAADNPDGFWEHLGFVKLNDEILNAVGAAWDLPPRENQGFDSPILQPMRQKAELLIEQFVDHLCWGWKDPRNSLTLPFWQTQLPELKTLVIVRNPLEAAYSMHKRNGLSYALGLRLWEIYNQRVSAISNPASWLFTHYPAFFLDPEAELQRIASFIGLPNNDHVSEAATLVAMQRRHTTFSHIQMIDAGVAESVIDLYEKLAAKATGHGKGKHRKKRETTPASEALTGSESYLRLNIPDGEAVRQELAQRRGAEIQQREELARHQSTIEKLREELAAKSLRAAAEINRRDGRIEELQKAYAHLDGLLRNEQAQRNHLWGELERSLRECWPI